MTTRSLVVRNPYSGEELSRLAFLSGDDLAKILQQATASFQAWRNSTSFERSQLLTAVADRLEARQKEFSELIRDEAGKPIRYAEIEVARCVGVLRWAAAEAQRFAGELLRIDTTAGGRPGFGINTRFPRGVILGITPFNFPLNLVAHKIAPAIASGCSIVVKPSPATPLTSLRLAELFVQSGAPKGLVQVALADDKATEKLTQAREIAMVSFTGSARVGKLIRAQAHDKPVTLELGGNAYVIVMDDVSPDLYPAIARRISGAAFGYAGQSCISVQNVAVASSAFSKVRESLAETTEKIAFGDPSNPQVISGPVINEAAARRIQIELDHAPKELEIVHSKRYQTGKSEATPSLIVKPTLLTIPDGRSDFLGSPLVQEEVFGPVMVASQFKELDELILRINSSPYGLQAGVFTQNWAVIERLYRELQVGGLVVNDVPTTRYDHQPYGGVKDSGQGREGIRYAMEEMTEAKFLALSSTIATS